MTTIVDSLVEDYLGRLSDAAAVLSTDQRTDLLEGIHEHIADARATGGAADEATTRALLDRLGTPEEIVAAALADGRSAWPPAPAGRGLALEGWAVGMLTVGSLLPFIGWFIGVALLWTSRRWSTGDKLLGTLVVPLGPLGPLFYLSLLDAPECGPQVTTTVGDRTTVSRACESSSSLPGWLTAGVFVLTTVACTVVAVTLFRRASARASLEPGGVQPSAWSGLETSAVVVLAGGSLLFPLAGQVIGTVLVAMSPMWRLRDKAIAIILVLLPFVTAAVAVAALAIAGDVDPPGTADLGLIYAVSLLTSVAAAVFLGLRLRGRTATPATMPGG